MHEAFEISRFAVVGHIAMFQSFDLPPKALSNVAHACGVQLEMALLAVHRWSSATDVPGVFISFVTVSPGIFRTHLNALQFTNLYLSIYDFTAQILIRHEGRRLSSMIANRHFTIEL